MPLIRAVMQCSLPPASPLPEASSTYRMVAMPALLDQQTRTPPLSTSALDAPLTHQIRHVHCQARAQFQTRVERTRIVPRLCRLGQNVQTRLKRKLQRSAMKSLIFENSRPRRWVTIREGRKKARGVGQYPFAL